MNKSNISDVDVLLPTKIDENFTIFTQQLEGNWTSPEPSTVYPENIQQKWIKLRSRDKPKSKDSSLFVYRTKTQEGTKTSVLFSSAWSTCFSKHFSVGQQALMLSKRNLTCGLISHLCITSLNQQFLENRRSHNTFIQKPNMWLWLIVLEHFSTCCAKVKKSSAGQSWLLHNIVRVQMHSGSFFFSIKIYEKRFERTVEFMQLKWKTVMIARTWKLN